MAKQKTKMSKKKKASIATAGVLAVALLAGGAFAWTDYSQTANNTFRGNVTADVLLHDDFDGTNKDVYVENTGNSDVFVRVKFAEYLQIGNNSNLPAFEADTTLDEYDLADPNDVTTWPIHTFTGDSTEDNTCNNNAKGAHTYYQWNMSGAQKQYLAGVTEADSNGRGGLTKEAFDALGVGKDHTFTLGTITTYKNNTEPKAEPMMLSAWLALEEAARPTAGCWLLDTDGWAYWSQPLKSGTATNLILDEVTVKNASPYDNWIYYIDVQLQAASANELNYWYLDGEDEPIANPDNNIATTTKNGYDFIQKMAGEYFVGADGLYIGGDGAAYMHLGNNVFQKTEQVDSNYVLDENADPLVAGQDRIPATDDDNLLSGRNTEWGGGTIAITLNNESEDSGAWTYTINGANGDYVVNSGLDKLLGTYDDVITSPSGKLGTYDIDNTDNDNNVSTNPENIGWQYLGGPVDDMLVATEYVLDNVMFNAINTTNNSYAGSTLQEKMEEIYTNMGGSSLAVVKTKDVSMEICEAENVMVCINPDHDPVANDHSTGACESGVSAYYTSSTDTGPIVGQHFFALSINEVIAAFGDNRTPTAVQYTKTQGAPAWLSADENKIPSEGNKNWNNTHYTDGDGNTISTCSWWLRSPGYTDAKTTIAGSIGRIDADYLPTDARIGARPACYMDLTASTSAGS